MNFSLDYFYPGERINFEIKRDAEHFIVEEISEFGLIEIDGGCDIFPVKNEKSKFLWFVLIKKNWPTDKAIKAIAKALRVSQKRFNWAGTKDKRAKTSQLCSAFAIEKEQIKDVKIRDLIIKCPFYMKDKIKLGSLIGNRFSIFMDERHYDHLSKRNVDLFPNYYGEQRFGIRRHTHKIGYFIIKEMFEEAAYIFLTDTNYELNPKAISARNSLKEHGDFAKAFEEFPKHLYLERMMLNHLKDHPRDFVNAFRKLPRTSLLTFVHAFQSFLFNRELALRFKEQGYEIKKERNEYLCSRNKFGFPDLNKKGNDFLVANIIGYESEINSYEEELLDEFLINKENFNIKSFPELSVKGSRRTLLSPIINPEFKNNFFSFSLQAGSYATSMLNTFFNTTIKYNY